MNRKLNHPTNRPLNHPTCPTSLDGNPYGITYRSQPDKLNPDYRSTGFFHTDRYQANRSQNAPNTTGRQIYGNVTYPYVDHMKGMPREILNEQSISRVDNSDHVAYFTSKPRPVPDWTKRYTHWVKK